MSKCSTVCSSDLKYRVAIQTKVLTATNGSSVDFTETLTTLATVWAKIDVDKGYAFFDSMTRDQQERTATHTFTVRYRTDVSVENYILYDSKYYEILNVQEFDAENQFLVIKCKVIGTSAQAAAKIGVYL